MVLNSDPEHKLLGSLTAIHVYGNYQLFHVVTAVSFTPLLLKLKQEFYSSYLRLVTNNIARLGLERCMTGTGAAA